ncbi:macro domain-containing protein [Caldicellulosiruptor kronotskyensis]|uniref:macro domain-containing protein n=1 Tax=Caldicellulosiruptor kronotskyensis TaxID=413889 RepID=UPI0001E9B652|nr:macro domain-containing protein [Caldicellulosiruptor kronotskyensis]
MKLNYVENISNITFYLGTVFNAGADAVVNKINCMGVMGTGIALEFKLRYPKMYEDYVNRCKKS